MAGDGCNRLHAKNCLVRICVSGLRYLRLRSQDLAVYICTREFKYFGTEISHVTYAGGFYYLLFYLSKVMKPSTPHQPLITIAILYHR